jgi:hypothetical protein
MSDGEPGRMTGPPLSVPKIRFCNNGDEVRRGRDVRSDHGHPCLQIFNSLFYASVALTEIIKPGHSQQSLSGAREVIKRAVFPPEDRAGVLFNTQGADALTI